MLCPATTQVAELDGDNEDPQGWPAVGSWGGKRQPMVAKSQEKQTLEHADWWNCALISQLTGLPALVHRAIPAIGIDPKPCNLKDRSAPSHAPGQPFQRHNRLWLQLRSVERQQTNRTRAPLSCAVLCCTVLYCAVLPCQSLALSAAA